MIAALQMPAKLQFIALQNLPAADGSRADRPRSRPAPLMRFRGVPVEMSGLGRSFCAVMSVLGGHLTVRPRFDECAAATV